MMYITFLERENKGKENQTITGDNRTTISCDAPLHMEKDMVAHLGRLRKASFGH
jgi:hypothetical protein